MTEKAALPTSLEETRFDGEDMSLANAWKSLASIKLTLNFSKLFSSLNVIRVDCILNFPVKVMVGITVADQSSKLLTLSCS